MSACGYAIPDYLSPWDEQQGHAPAPLTCNLPAGHTGNHRSAEDGMPFGPPVPMSAERKPDARVEAVCEVMHDAHQAAAVAVALYGEA